MQANLRAKFTAQPPRRHCIYCRRCLCFRHQFICCAWLSRLSQQSMLCELLACGGVLACLKLNCTGQRMHSCSCRDCCAPARCLQWLYKTFPAELGGFGPASRFEHSCRQRCDCYTSSRHALGASLSLFSREKRLRCLTWW